jgi:hypothetical protein
MRAHKNVAMATIWGDKAKAGFVVVPLQGAREERQRRLSGVTAIVLRGRVFLHGASQEGAAATAVNLAGILKTKFDGRAAANDDAGRMGTAEAGEVAARRFQRGVRVQPSWAASVLRASRPRARRSAARSRLRQSIASFSDSIVPPGFGLPLNGGGSSRAVRRLSSAR